MTRVLSDAERASEIASLRESNLGFADAVTNLAKLTDDRLEDFIEPAPIPPPPPLSRLEILERDFALEKSRREQQFNDYIADLKARLDAPRELWTNPYEHPSVRQLHKLAEEVTPGYAQEIAAELHASGDLDEVELGAATELIDEIRRGNGETKIEEPVGLPSGHPLVSKIIEMAGGDADTALRLVSDLDFHVCEKLLKVPGEEGK